MVKQTKKPKGFPEETYFKKGNPGGPGRPKKDPAEAKALKLTKTKIEAYLTEFLFYDKDQLLAIIDDPKKSVIEHWIAQICAKGIDTGDYGRFNFMMDRIVGKVKDVQELQMPKPTIIRKRDGEIITLGTEDVKEIKE